MITLTKKVEVAIEVTPEVLADAFCRLDNNEQARFFNSVAADAETWPNCNLELQIMYVLGSSELNDKGRKAMRIIGDNDGMSNNDE